jgi:hypothetical protein
MHKSCYRRPPNISHATVASLLHALRRHAQALDLGIDVLKDRDFDVLKASESGS